MKKISFLFCCFSWAQLFGQTTGSLDISFANNGISTVDRSTFESNVAFAVQPDGKVVTVGFSEDLGTSKLTVFRYLPAGNLDETFANQGVFEGTFNAVTNHAQAVALQPDGKILVAGYVTSIQPIKQNNEDLLVLRFNANGTLDNTFGLNGVQKLNLEFNERPVGIQLTSDNKILIAGTEFKSTTANFFVYRLNSNGNVDNTFGTDGVKRVFITNGAWNYCHAMTLQPDGKILLAGEVKSFTGFSFALIRLEANGDYDTSFSGDGKTTNNIGSTDDGATAMALQADGKILLGGYSVTTNSKTALVLTRFNPDGSLDGTFGASGDILMQLGTDYCSIADLCLTPSGKIMVAGTAKRYPSYFDFFLARFKSDGSLDTDFGDQGVAYTDYEGHYDGITDAQILPDGKLLVAGMGVKPSNSISEFLLARYWIGESSGIQEITQGVAAAWAYPNPTSARRITLNYELTEASSVSHLLYSSSGVLLATLSTDTQVAGKQKVALTLPSNLAAGSYLIGIQTGEKQTYLPIIVQ